MPTITTIAPGHWLDTAPAASYLRMRAAGCPAGITDAGRTNAEQVALFTARYTTNYYLSGKTDKRVWAGNVWWRKPRVAAAGVPGTSKHETGRALDLPAAAAAWVRAHGAAYGWIAGLVAGEWWHMEYVATRDTKAKTPTPTQEDDMPTAQEVAQAVWTMALGPTGATSAAPAWAHLIAAREAAAGASAAASSAAAAVGPLETADPHLGPAPLARFVGDTRTDVMRILDIARGQTAQIAALPAAIIAALPPAAAGVGVSLEQVEAAVKFALGTLTLKSV